MPVFWNWVLKLRPMSWMSSGNSVKYRAVCANSCVAMLDALREMSAAGVPATARFAPMLA
jgi:hypothetical protein